MRKKFLIRALLLFQLVAQIQAQTESYLWKSVQIHGGGYVTGFVFSKAAPGILYARTDVGGAYRWDFQRKQWIALSDAWGSTAAWGVLSLATDPHIPGKIYAASGRGSGTLRVSADSGKTWIGYPTPFRIDGNMAGRGTGERLQVDPHQSSILWYGSGDEGLFRSADSGKTWQSVSSFPCKKITFVYLDSSSGRSGFPTPHLYVGTADRTSPEDTVSGQIYFSEDAGNSWNLLPGQPVKVLAKSWFPAAEQYSRPAIPQRMAIGGNTLWFTFSDQLAPASSTGGVYKMDRLTRSWTQVFPLPHTAQGAYCAIAVHPENPDIVLVGSLGRWYPRKDEMHLTMDGGKSWVNLNDKIIWGNPYGSIPAATSWMSDVQINPWDGNHAIFNSGASTHQTYNFKASFGGAPTQWDLLTKGIEETVILGLTGSPAGLYSAIGDIGGFRHLHPDSTAKIKYNTGSGNTYNVDFAELYPAFMVRAHDGGGASYSLDSGNTWKSFPATPARVKRAGWISVSCDARTIIWAAADSFVYRTRDTGKTWEWLSSVPINGRPRADRKDPSRFYIPQTARGRVMISTDSGKTFLDQPEGFPRTASGASFTVSFDSAGHLWMSLGNNGLFFSRDGGMSWNKIATVKQSFRIALGKGKKAWPTLFLSGTINDIQSIWRSDDRGQNWVCIHDSTRFPQGLHRVVAVMEGDRQIYGRLYVGTGGRGIFYGEPVLETPVINRTRKTPSLHSQRVKRDYRLNGERVSR